MVLPALLEAGYRNLTHVEWSQCASLGTTTSTQAIKRLRSPGLLGDLNQWEPPALH